MIGAWLSAAGVALVSAFVPVVPIEPYLLGVVAVTGHGAVGLGIAAGIGQTLGKLLIFLGARGTLRSQALQRWLAKHTARFRQPAPVLADGTVAVAGAGAPVGHDSDPTGRWRLPGRPTLRRWSRALTGALARPALAVPVLLLSATLGMPPLLLVTFYAAGTRMRAAVFAAVCLAGRTARFIAVAAVPDLAHLV
ncbi:MAG TPA: hypothetical protein VES42_11285 [Pilimelia sp.]|nr:hypothetical protein [Pilimelia sp.]